MPGAGGQGCSLLSRLQPPTGPRWLLCGAEGGLTSWIQERRQVCSCLHQTQEWARLLLPGQARGSEEDKWFLASSTLLWGSFGQKPGSHCHPQGPSGSQAEPGVKRKEGHRQETSGLCGQKRAVTHKHCTSRPKAPNMDGCGGLCGQRASLGPWDPSAQGHFEGLRLVPKAAGISLGGGRCVQAKPQDKHCARDLPHLLSLILSTASETHSLLLILQVRKVNSEQHAQGHKASRQQTQDANSDETSTQLSLLHPAASHSE